MIPWNTPASPCDGWTVVARIDVSRSNLDNHCLVIDFDELVDDFLRRLRGLLAAHFPGADVSVEAREGGWSFVTVEDEDGRPFAEDPGLIDGVWRLWDQILDDDAAMRRYDAEIDAAMRRHEEGES